MAESPRMADAETGGVGPGTKGRADVVGGGRRLVRTAAGGRVAWAVVRALTPQASLVWLGRPRPAPLPALVPGACRRVKTKEGVCEGFRGFAARSGRGGRL